MQTYNRTRWQDHVTDGETVIQQGTPQSATNFNNIEEGVFAADSGLSVLAQQMLQNKRALADLEGESGQVALSNTLEYPFSNSEVTVNLQKPRDTLNYRVIAEVASSVGVVGEIIVYDKQLNGFKVRHTGSATSVTVKYYVVGGMYQ